MSIKKLIDGLIVDYILPSIFRDDVGISSLYLMAKMKRGGRKLDYSFC